MTKHFDERTICTIFRRLVLIIVRLDSEYMHMLGCGAFNAGSTSLRSRDSPGAAKRCPRMAEEDRMRLCSDIVHQLRLALSVSVCVSLSLLSLYLPPSQLN